jgi:hypothetical protein
VNRPGEDTTKNRFSRINGVILHRIDWTDRRCYRWRNGEGVIRGRLVGPIGVLERSHVVFLNDPSLTRRRVEQNGEWSSGVKFGNVMILHDNKVSNCKNCEPCSIRICTHKKVCNLCEIPHSHSFRRESIILSPMIIHHLLLAGILVKG